MKTKIRISIILITLIGIFIITNPTKLYNTYKENKYIRDSINSVLIVIDKQIDKKEAEFNLLGNQHNYYHLMCNDAQSNYDSATNYKERRACLDLSYSYIDSMTAALDSIYIHHDRLMNLRYKKSKLTDLSYEIHK